MIGLCCYQSSQMGLSLVSCFINQLKATNKACKCDCKNQKCACNNGKTCDCTESKCCEQYCCKTASEKKCCTAGCAGGCKCANCECAPTAH
ncbi:unnamed protein product [Caenorhabditis brenneri]